MGRITMSVAGTLVLLLGLVVLYVGLASGLDIPNESGDIEVKAHGAITAVSCPPAQRAVTVADPVGDWTSRSMRSHRHTAR